MKRRQKNEKGSKQSLLLSAALLVFTLITQAQVTIGSGIEPAPGALLDLKERSDGTSTKGLMLPRVALTSLKPSTTKGTNSLAASVGSPETESWDMAAHTGMMVSFSQYSILISINFPSPKS